MYAILVKNDVLALICYDFFYNDIGGFGKYVQKKENEECIMKIKCRENTKLNHQEISISYHPKNKDVVDLLLKFVNEVMGEIDVYDECHNYYSITIMSIYYIEIVDHKIFVYTKDNVYRRSDTMKSLRELLKPYGFFQVNVRTMVNKYHIVSYKVNKDCRRVLYLDNDEQIIVNRNFREELKKHASKM